MKPHPLTSRLSHFRRDVTTSATSEQPLANSIHQAQCEITGDSILALSASPSLPTAQSLSAMAWEDKRIEHWYSCTHSLKTRIRSPCKAWPTSGSWVNPGKHR